MTRPGPQALAADSPVRRFYCSCADEPLKRISVMCAGGNFKVSFRRSKNEGVERRRWRAFCVENQELIADIDLPSPVVETQERFEDLLMHGYLDHHHDSTQFSVNKLDSAKLEKFRALVDRYFEAGYFDPGLMAVGHEERLRLAKKYPNQFDNSFRAN